MAYGTPAPIVASAPDQARAGESFHRQVLHCDRLVLADQLHYWRAQRLWSGSYFAGSVGGAPLSTVKQYIEQQNRPL